MLDHAVEPEAEIHLGLKKNEPKDTLVVTAFVAASQTPAQQSVIIFESML